MPGFWARYVEPGYLLVVRPDSALVAVPFDAKTQTDDGTADRPRVRRHRPREQRSPRSPSRPPDSWCLQPAQRTALACDSPACAATGRRPSSIRRGSARRVRLAVSPDGVHAAAVVNRGTWDIQERDLRTGALSYVSVPATVASDPVFSSDGQSLLFIAGGPAGRQALRGGTGERVGPAPRVRQRAPRTSTSRRRRRTVARSTTGRAWAARSDIYAHALDQPGSSDRAVLATPAREKSPRPSPDGRWLAYVSDECGHRRGLRALHGCVALRAMAGLGRRRTSASLGAQWTRAVLPLSRQPHGRRGVERRPVQCRRAAELCSRWRDSTGTRTTYCLAIRLSHAAGREQRSAKESGRLRRSVDDVAGGCEGAAMREQRR